MSNFIILVGGPGLFKGCDKAHDQTWLNYIVPIQLAAQKNLYHQQSGEKIHWVIYEPPYKNRWLDDSIITKEEKKQSDGFHLHSLRKTAADNIAKKGAVSYLDRIKQISLSNRITYKGINTPGEFWQYLKSMPDHSISRVWYSGHASGNELMLALTHNSTCQAAAFKKDAISISDISKHSGLKSKFIASSKNVSKFYGCFTSDFAKEWNKTYGVSSAGAKMKIDFGVINQPSSIVNVLERIEKSSTSLGSPDWKEFK